MLGLHCTWLLSIWLNGGNISFWNVWFVLGLVAFRLLCPNANNYQAFCFIVIVFFDSRFKDKKTLFGRAWWCTLLILALGRQRQANFWVRGQPGLQSEFQDSQDYAEKPCLEKNKKQTNKKKTAYSFTTARWAMSFQVLALRVLAWGDQVALNWSCLLDPKQAETPKFCGFQCLKGRTFDIHGSTPPSETPYCLFGTYKESPQQTSMGQWRVHSNFLPSTVLRVAYWNQH